MDTSGKVDLKSLDQITSGTVDLTKRLVKHAQSHPLVSSRDASEVKAIVKLALDVSSQMTSDPLYMAKLVENMDKDKVSSLNEWLRLNKTMGK